MENTTKQQVFGFLFSCNKSEFDTLETMSRYLNHLEEGLSTRMIALQSKRQNLLSQYKTCVMAQQISEKRRVKEQTGLKEEGSKLKQKVRMHQTNMSVDVHPMMPELKAKSDQIRLLEETKTLLSDFQRLSAGEDPQTVLSFSEALFQETAHKIPVLKAVVDDLPVSQQNREVKAAIQKLLLQLREHILHRFQSAYWNKDFRQIKDTLPLCLSLNLMEDVSQFYISKVFRKASTLRNVDVSSQRVVNSQVNNLYFLLQQGFKQAFLEKDDDLSYINQYQIFHLFGSYSDNVLKSLINYIFQTVMKDSMEAVLKQPLPNESYVMYLQLFVRQTDILRMQILKLIGGNQSLAYTVDSYISILFEPYQEQYLLKQLGFLEDIYEANSNEIMNRIEIKMGSVKKKQFKWKNLFSDYKIQQSQRLTGQQMSQRISKIMAMFMDPNLESIFEATNKSLMRCTKISKSTEKERNTVAILDSFMKEMGELILNLIKYTGSLIPSYDRRTVLSQQYFQIVPLLNATVQRMELVFQTFSVQKSNINEGILLAQQKEQLMASCEQELQKILRQALSSLQIGYNSILKQLCSSYNSVRSNQSATEGCSKTINFTAKYVKKIRSNYSVTSQHKILELIGTQFLQLLMQHYAGILYRQDGLYQLLVDVGHYKQFMTSLGNSELQSKYCSLKSLVDIYLLKNEEISLMNYVNEEKQRSLGTVKQDLITRYIENKKKNELE